MPEMAIRVLAVMAALLLAVLSLSPNGATRLLLWPWWGAWRLLLALPPLLWMALSLRKTRSTSVPRLKPAMAVLVFAFAGWQVIAALASPHPQTSLAAALALVSCGCVVPLASAASDRPRAVAAILGTAGVVFAIVSLATWVSGIVIPVVREIAARNAALGADVFTLDLDALRNDRPLGHSNYTGGVAVLALPWVALLAWRARGSARIAWSAGGVLVALTLLTSQSRGAILGLAGSAAFFVVLLGRAARWPRRRFAVFAVVGAILLSALVALTPRARRPLVDLLAGRGPNIGDTQRLAMVRIGTAMGAERWWLGQGPGLIPRLYPKYRHTVDGGVDTALQLHSTPFQLWTETGAPGLLAAAGILITALGAAMRHRQPAERTPSGFLVRGAAGISLAGYAILSLTDFQLNVPLLAVWTAANVGILGAESTTIVRTGRRVARALVPAALLVLFAVVTPREWQARRLLAEAIDHLERGDDPRFFEAKIQAAAALRPDDPAFLAGGGAAMLRLAFTTRDAAAQSHQLSAARGFLERVLTVEPDLEFAHFNLGWLKLADDPRSAAGHFRHAQRLVPDRGGVYLGLGLARLETGDVARGVEALALEILNDLAFLTSPAWDSEALAPHRDAAIERAVALAALPPFASAAEVLRWWRGQGPPSVPDRDQRIDTALTPAIPGLIVLRQALATPQSRRELLGRFLFIRTKRAATEDEIDILERLLDRCGDDWRAWLTATEGREPPFLRVVRRERPAFAMLAGNLDIPVPLDAYLVQENGIAALFFDSLFPRRGHLYDPALVDHVAHRDL